MLSERMLSGVIRAMTKRHLALKPTSETRMPAPKPGQAYMLYMHVPFCQRLCPYCSFNRYPFREEVAGPYFASMRKEMLMLKNLGYDFESIYIGGGTPTIMIDELCETIDLARGSFDVKEVSSETNPNHLTHPYLEKLKGRVQRLSVGVQSFNDDLLKQMDRYDKYGSGDEILERIAEAAPYFDSLNVDMIFNFPTQTEDILRSDLEKVVQSGCRQTTFSPLYVSSATTQKMVATLGKMDYDREYRFYQMLDGVLAGGEDPFFRRSTAWTFSRFDHNDDDHSLLIDEYMVSYEEYPAIGSGAITHLNGALYVNNFSISEYNAAIANGQMSIMGKTALNRADLMRYRFLLQLYRLRLDKKQFKQDFGCSIEAGLPMEMAFMRASRAFETDNSEELTLTPIGRYLTLVMYRQFLSGLNNLRDQARAALSGTERELLFGEGIPA
ncbi:MAG: coproporphyrinogen III oxidase family protein [Coriobacteriia bacterium]|nr:coproporphyrinogen III oxidase family protein [Coriobacteriia bacterium]